MAYPLGVPHRQPRPRRERSGGGAVAGGVIGGLIGGPLGILLGGALGHTGETPPPFPLEEALRHQFENRGTQLVELYRHGPFRIEAVFLTNTGFWTIVSTAPRVQGWTQVDLDDWLFGDMIDYHLDPWIRSYGARLL
ncbi:MAG: hypothetical protein NT062_25055 [Proteobacteria bacterium]|nr:hypothetical protein [Pseudomonadota bacterium]